MSIGASLYAYRNNFGCVQKKQAMGRSTKIKLFNLILDGYRTVSKFDDDYFVCLAQYFLKKGYPRNFTISDKMENLNKFFMEALFSIDPFHYQSLFFNCNNFDLFQWREQFERFAEIKIDGLNFYRSRSAMPLENFSSMSNVYKIIYTNRDFYGQDCSKLKHSFNSHWPDAIWIISKYCTISKDCLYYTISYGCEDDYEAFKKGSSGSSWDITIESEPDENYIDFCLRIFKNYDAIISGDSNILIHKYSYGSDHYFLKND
jgi:hypothetical protein